MAATDGIAVDHRNHGFGQTTDLHLYVEYTETRHTLFVDITATTFYVHIASRTEGVLDIRKRFAFRHF